MTNCRPRRTGRSRTCASASLSPKPRSKTRTASCRQRVRNWKKHNSSQPTRHNWRHCAIVSHSSKRTIRSEEHTSELQSRENLVCRLLLEKKKIMQGEDLQTAWR